ncbi:hypothetical protein HK100_008109 [Physocladia obscura]|uniref:Uncharacterized protein n=1 Tax=Physocladia obscura TaxID=109957 RepID=A0AAD5TBZ7_9FUNG|nr:hypothetical protein HK100_008109 [Physocladia obscura]
MLDTQLAANVTSVQIVTFTTSGFCAVNVTNTTTLASVASYTLNTCLPSLEEYSNAYSIYYTDLGGKIYKQNYSSPICFMSEPSWSLQNQRIFVENSTEMCDVFNQTGKIVNSLGYQASYYSGNEISTVANVTECNSQNTTVAILFQPATPWIATPVCAENTQYDPKSYDIAQDAKNKFAAAEPYAVFDIFSEPNCRSNSTVVRKAVLLDTCLVLSLFPDSGNMQAQKYTVVSNGSLTVNYYADYACENQSADILQSLAWDNATCTEYANVGNIRLFNLKSSAKLFKPVLYMLLIAVILV